MTFNHNPSLISNRKPIGDENLMQKFDSITIDEDNHYLINFS